MPKSRMGFRAGTAIDNTFMTLATFLFDALDRAGVRQIFGIPGDFALPLYEAFQHDGRFQIVRFSHEPAVGFAADGSARISGRLGVCCVTYGAGGLNMVNSVACAYAEESPLVVLSGGPGRAERRRGVHVHHQVKTYESQLRVYAEVTEYAAILDDPETAATHITRAIDVAARLKRPVYLEIPRDMVNEPIETSDARPATIDHGVDEGAVEEAAQEILARLRGARHPVIIVGVEVHRFRLREQVVRLAERLNVPVASSFLGRGVFPTRHPQFAGTYLGVVSPQPLRDVVESSDCVLLLGERISDTSLGVSADRLTESNLILAVADDVFIGHHQYHRTPLTRIVERLEAEESLPRRTDVFDERPEEDRDRPARPAGTDPVTVRQVIEVLNDFLDEHPEVPLVCDTGDALFASVEIRSNEVMAPAYYATMGFAVPAALGLQVTSRRRPIVLVGDGAFQMTGPEISHAPEYDCNPVVIVLNNTSWEMLQAFFPTASYNRTAAWPFARLAELWGGHGTRVTTARELESALTAAWIDTRFSIIEVPLAPGDISPVLARFVAEFKKRVY
jgi:indolepyruvate decarboxylase